MYKVRTRDEGFTLVELLVAITILGIITTALGTALFIGVRAAGDDQRNLDQSNAQQLVSHFLTSDIKAACSSSVAVPACLRSPNPSSSPGVACGSTAQFAIDVTATANAPVVDTTIAYTLTGTTLTRSTCAYATSSISSSRVLAQNVGALVASYPASGPCAGQFDLTVTITGSTSGNGTPDFTFAVCSHRRAG